MSIYNDLKDVTSEILGEFGQGSVNLVQVVAGSGPDDNPGESIKTSIALNAVVSGVSFEYVQNGLATKSDLMVTSAVVDDITPTEKDFIEIDSETYKIVKDVSVPSAGTKCAWKFIVRKGG